MDKIAQYLNEFKPLAAKWFSDNTVAADNHSFFSEFFKKENLEKAEWPDFQKLRSHIHAFNAMALAGGNALGNPNHPIEHYRNSFLYLLYGGDRVEERVRKFYDDDKYKLAYFGRSAVSELVGYAFPDEFIFLNERDRFAADFLDITFEKPKGGDLVDELVSFAAATKSVAQLYDQIVGRQTRLPLNLELDQFFSWLYETYGEEDDPPPGKPTIDYWVIAAGEGGDHWEDFSKHDLIAIGWDKLGDLRQYDSQELIRQALNTNYEAETSQNHKAKACWQFSRAMKPGDTVFVRGGSKTIVAHGIVQSDYVHDKTRDTFRNTRNVQWMRKGSFELPDDHRVAVKTLTRVTRWPDFVELIKKTVGIESPEINPTPNGKTQYWWLNANPKIWDLEGTPLGTIQNYSSYNEKGNKRQKFKYFHEVKPGDLLIGYVTSPDKEIVALCRITKALSGPIHGERIEFEVVEKLGHPVSYESLVANPALADSEPIINNQGSLFRLTQEEYEVIRSMIDELNIGVEVPPVKYTKKEAIRSLFVGESQFDQMVESLREKKNVVLQGPPGVGKTYVAKRLAYAFIGSKDDSRVEMIQFHQSYSYEDFIQGFRPNSKGQFDLKSGVFYQFCRKAQRDDETKPYVFIIDEINRGNLSKIFGELMMLIEPDKRGKEFAIPLAYSQTSEERFFIPPNVHLVGTMNTADRSLAMVDYALRRRFRFITLEPEFKSPKFQEYLKGHGAVPGLIQKIIDRMTMLNQAISIDTKNLGSGYKIGHSYFCLADNAKATEEWYRNVVESEVLPLLKEYWFDDEEKVSSFRNSLLS